eukprot:5775061-Ditylum_brightwellii.AAC.1
MIGTFFIRLRQARIQTVYIRLICLEERQMFDFGNDKEDVDETVTQLKQAFDLTDEGETVEQYLGFKINQGKDGSFRMHQPHLVKSIIDVIPGMDRANEHNALASTSVTPTKDVEVEKRKENWDYRLMIGMFNVLVNSTIPELAHTVHQCTRFCADPKASN